MLTLPAAVLPLIIEFAPLFSKPVWEHAKILLVGAILATARIGIPNAFLLPPPCGVGSAVEYRVPVSAMRRQDAGASDDCARTTTAE